MHMIPIKEKKSLRKLLSSARLDWTHLNSSFKIEFITLILMSSNTHAFLSLLDFSDLMNLSRVLELVQGVLDFTEHFAQIWTVEGSQTL